MSLKGFYSVIAQESQREILAWMRCRAAKQLWAPIDAD